MDAHQFRPGDRRDSRRAVRARTGRATTPRLEGLERRELLSGMANDVAKLPTGAESGPVAVARDGSLWFAQSDATGATALGKATASGQLTEVKVPGAVAGGSIGGLAPDTAGDIWFTYAPPATAAPGATAQGEVGKVAPDGSVTQYGLPTQTDRPGSVAVAPDGSVWIALDASGATSGNATGTPSIARVNSDGSLTSFPVTGASEVKWLTAASDGNLWFVDGQRIGKVTPTGVVSFFSLPAPSDGSAINLSNAQLTPTSDGGLWFIGLGGLGRIDNSGQVKTVPAPGSTITSLGTASDGNVWFSFLPPTGSTLAATPGAYVARMSLAGQITVFPTPVDSSAPVVRLAGTPAAGIWMAEQTDTLALANLASLPSYTPAIVSTVNAASFTAVQGQPFSGEVIEFASNRSDGTAPTYSATINWGDGHTTPGVVTPTSSGTYIVTGTNTYTLAPNSSATVSVTVTDGKGGYAVLSNQVTIQTAPAPAATSTLAAARALRAQSVASHRSATVAAAQQARQARAAHPRGPVHHVSAPVRTAKRRHR
jgi:virginiamycin B lyase